LNFYKRISLGRGNIPRMDDKDDTDPYRHKSPNDGQGYDMNRAGDEEVRGHGSGMGGGLGSRFRANVPSDALNATDFASGTEEEYDEQTESDIPTSSHALMEKYPLPDSSPGTDLFTFEDYRDSPFLFDMLNGRKYEEPVGPHNMQNHPGLYQQVRNRLK